MCKHILLKLTQSWQPQSTTNPKVVDRQIQTVCLSNQPTGLCLFLHNNKNNRLKEHLLPKSWQFWAEIGAKTPQDLFALLNVIVDWEVWFCEQLSVSSWLSFTCEKILPKELRWFYVKERVCFSILDRSQPLFLLRTSGKVILKVNLARLSPFSNPLLCNLVKDGSSLKNLLARPVLECVFVVAGVLCLMCQCVFYHGYQQCFVLPRTTPNQKL